jgi:ribosomal protein S18 acetylase RimI-like enzyme
MEIRRPTIADAREVRAARARAWRAGHGDLVSEDALAAVTVDPDADDLERWRERIERWRDRMLVADDDGVVGYAQFRRTETKPFVGDDEAGLKELYVRPDRWGDGVGTALLGAGVERLSDDVTAVRLETLAGNERAAAFYEARGFERTGERTVEVAGEEYPGLIYVRRLG